MKKNIEDFKIKCDRVQRNFTKHIYAGLFLGLLVNHFVYADWKHRNAPPISQEMLNLVFKDIAPPEGQPMPMGIPLGEPLEEPTPLPAGTFETEIEELARSLRYNPDLIFQFVHNHIKFEPRMGDIKGAYMTLMDRSGGPCDQASLMIELLRASGYSSAQHVLGSIRLTFDEASNWLGVPNNQDFITNAFAWALIPYELFENQDVIDVDHFWVSVNLDGIDYVFDPSFKVHNIHAGINLDRVMSEIAGYSQTDFIGDVTAGSTSGSLFGANYVQSLNTSNLQQKLILYSDAIIDYFRTHHQSESLEDIMGGVEIIPSFRTYRYTELPYQTPDISPTRYISLPDCLKYSLEITLPGNTSIQLPSSEIYGRRLTITYNDNLQPVLRREGGDPLIVGDGASAQGITQQIQIACSIYNQQVESEFLSIKAGGTYCILNGWGNIGQNIISRRRDNLRRFLDEGLDNNSESVLGESLFIKALSWLAQNDHYSNVLSKITGSHRIHYFVAGISGHFSSPYVDIPICISGGFSFNGVNAETVSDFLTGGFYSSALEWGVISQSQPGADAVSTIRLLDQANLNGDRIFEVTKANFDTFLTTDNFQSYDGTTISSLRQNFTNLGPTDNYVIWMPDKGQLSVSDKPNSWKGYGLLAFTQFDNGALSASYRISGDYHGGHGAWGNMIYDPSDISVYAPMNVHDIQGKNNSENPQAPDPIDLFSGAFLYDHSDMNVGIGAYPYSLDFKRSYSSANALNDGPMGKGWSHNYEITARKSSNGFKAMGSDSPVDAAAAMVATYINYDLLKNRTLENVVISAMTTKWMMDQMIDNVVTVSQPGSSMVFTKLPDGSYNPPPGKSGELTLTNDRYHLRDKKGNQIQFNEAGLIEQWSDPAGRTVGFTYDTIVHTSPEDRSKIFYSYITNEWQAFPFDSELISHWKFDNPANLGYDSKGQNHAAMPSDTSRRPTYTDQGYYGGGLSFDQDHNDYLEVSNPSNMNQESYTLTFWAKLVPNHDGHWNYAWNDGYQGFIGKIQTFENFNFAYKVAFYCDEGWGQFRTTDSPTNSCYNSSLAILNENWCMWTLSVGNGVRSFYRNGWLEHPGTYTGSANLQNTYPFLIGSKFSYTSFYGIIDDVRFYKKALDASEVAKLYLNKKEIYQEFTEYKLKKVSNNYGQSLNFVYTDGGSGPYVASVNDGKGRSVSFARNANDELTGYTDPEGNTTVYVYDPARKAHMTRIHYPTLPSLPFVTNVYNSLGQVKTQTNAEGETYHYYYSGYRSEEVNPLGDSMIHYFNNNGLVSAVEDQMGNTTRTLYDGQRRKIMDISPEGSSVRYRYDDNHNVIEIASAAHSNAGICLQLGSSNDTVTWSYQEAPINNFTFSAWVRASNRHEVDPESSSGEAGLSGQKFLCRPQDGVAGMWISVGVNGISVYESDTDYMPALAVYEGNISSGWNYITVTYTDKQPKIYLNGLLVRNGLPSLQTHIYAPSILGGAGWGYFEGDVRNVRVWDRPLTPAEVLKSMDGDAGGAGPVGVWNFDEGTGTIANDSSGNGQHGMLSGDLWGTVTKTAEVHSFISLNGEDDFIDIPASSPSSLNPGANDFTLSCWIKTNSTSPQGLISKKLSSVGYELYINSAGRITAFLGDGSDTVEIETEGEINLGEWTNVVASFERSGQCKIYLGGILSGTGDITSCTGSVSNESPLRIGKLSSGTSHFQGLLANISVWNSARSQQHIQNEIENGLTGTEEGLVGYWRLDESAGLTIYDTAINSDNHGTSFRNINLLVTTEADDFCYVERFVYESSYNNIRSRTDNAGNVTRYYYENSVFPSYVSKVEHPDIDGIIPATQYEYYTISTNVGSYGQIKTIKDAEGIITEYFYNEQGLSAGALHKTIVDRDGLQVTTETGYDSIGNISTIKDARGNVTTFGPYDKNRNLKKVTSAGPFNYVTRYDHDTLGRLTKTHAQSDFKGNPWLTVEKEYTPAGEIWKIISPKEDDNAALEFDKNSLVLNYASVPSNNFTISAWVKTSQSIAFVKEGKEGNATPSLFCSSRDRGNNRIIVSVAVGKNGIAVYENTDYRVQRGLCKAFFSHDIGTGWNHIAVTYEKPSGSSNATPKIYLNGAHAHIGLSSSGYWAYAPDKIGKGVFKGFVRDVRTWNKTLTAGDIEDVFAKKSVAMSNLLGHWEFDEGGHEIAYDSSGKNNHLTIPTPGPTWVSDGEKLVTEYVYDELNRVKEVIDANGNRTTTEYYPNGKVWRRIDAEQNTEVEYTYTPNGNVRSVKDANGNVTRYFYDGFGRLIKTVYPDDSSVILTYDDLGRLCQRTTRGGQHIAFEYDAIGRLRTKQTPEDTILYTYDILGRTDTITNSLGVIDYEYDTLGRLIHETTPGSKTVSYQYDLAGNVVKLTYPDGSYVTYDYDELNRLRSITDQDRMNVVTYQYDALSRRKRAYLGNGTITSYEYDLIGRLKSLNNQTANKSHHFAYTYDAVGNRLSMTVNGDQHHRYGYDNKYQLISVDYPVDYFSQSVSYEYDPVGNRENDSLGTIYQPNHLNQYETVDDITLTYDQNGNLTSDPETSATFIYDSENRLIYAITQTQSTSYTYDALGRRFAKNVDGAATYYVYSGVQVIGEYDGSDFNRDTATRTFVYGPGIDEPVRMDVLPRMDIDGDGIPASMQDFELMRASWLLRAGDVGFDARADLNHDGVVDNIDADILAGHWKVIRQQSGRFYFHADGLGSVAAVSGRDGRTVEVYRYDVFGRTVVYDGDGRRPRPVSAVGNPYFFTGRRLDFETGLYYYRARMYSPNLGRFLQTDPIGYADGINWYAYVGNNPVMFVDPWGLCGQQSGFWGSAWEGAWKGDFSGDTGWGGISAQVVIGFIPVVGQVADARDTVANIRNVWNSPGSGAAWAGLGGAAVAWVPGVGDAAKGAFKGGRKVVSEVGQAAVRNADNAADFAKWLNKGSNNVNVYKGFDAAGSDVYVGVTNNMARRQGEWGNTMKIGEMSGSLTRNQARAIEQVIIEQNPNYLNKINSISPNNPNYQQAIDWANTFLGNQ